MWNLPNILSLTRFPLALLFLIDSVPIRIIAIFVALLTDYLDGYIARSRSLVTRLGTALDPIADRMKHSHCDDRHQGSDHDYFYKSKPFGFCLPHISATPVVSGLP